MALRLILAELIQRDWTVHDPVSDFTAASL
jgi:hypothetical protein